MYYKCTSVTSYIDYSYHSYILATPLLLPYQCCSGSKDKPDVQHQSRNNARGACGKVGLSCDSQVWVTL